MNNSDHPPTVFRLDHIISHFETLWDLLQALSKLSLHAQHMTEDNRQRFTEWKMCLIAARLWQKEKIYRHEARDVLRAVEQIGNRDHILERQ